VPSAALQALVPGAESAVGTTIDRAAVDDVATDEVPLSEVNVFNRPSMAFVVEAHNLADLKRSMKQAVRKAACRSYALQVSEHTRVRFFVLIRKRRPSVVL